MCVMEKMLSPQQVATLFSVDPKTVSRWAREGKIKFVRTPGNHRRYPASEIRRLLGETLEAEPS